jgi:NAD(P)-dependent dehydrogenase (short-subunit alcohol dehydrogenase family)
MEEKQKKEYVLITGATSGIGSALAINLSQDYHIILHGRNAEKLQHVKALCDKENIQLIYTQDLSKSGEIEHGLAGFIADNKIEINHFIHCAGFLKMLPLKMISADTMNTTFAVNVISAALLIKILTQKKYNSQALKTIVFISSNISNFGAKAFNIYASSKGALDSLMRCLAVELAPRIRVNSVLPGAIHTDMTEAIFENKELLEKMAIDYPLGLGKPDDVCGIVQFLISEKSNWITGQQFIVDGGRTINISA